MMTIAVLFSLLVNIFPCLLVVAAIEPGVLDVETKDVIPSHVMCSSMHRNSPYCAIQRNFTSNFSNFTTFFEVTSRWSERLLVELFLLSAESHLLFCAERDQEREFEHRVIAKAVVEMLMGLHTMKDANEILTNVTRTVFLEDLQDKVCEPNLSDGDFFHRWLAQMDYSMKEESSLREEYAVKWAQAALDTSRQVMSNAYYAIDVDEDILCKLPIFRVAHVNRIFTEEVFSNRSHCKYVHRECQQYLQAKAMVELARKPDDGHQRTLLNQMYRGALLEVALEIDCRSGHSLLHTEQQTKDSLFDILKRRSDKEVPLSLSLTMRQNNLIWTNIIGANVE